MTTFTKCPTTGKIIAQMKSYADEGPNARRLYNQKNQRNLGVSEETRLNPIWRQLSRTLVGDLVVITKLGKSRVYGISRVLTDTRETRILAECITDPSIYASFSWRDYETIGIESFRLATAREIQAALPKVRTKRVAKRSAKPAAVAATAKVVAARRSSTKPAAARAATKRSGKSDASVPASV